NKGLPFTLINVILRAPLRNTRRGEKKRSDAREAEGAPLLREYRVKSSIEGSNPSHSASCEKAPVSGAFCFSASVFSARSEGAFCLQAWRLRDGPACSGWGCFSGCPPVVPCCPQGLLLSRWVWDLHCFGERMALRIGS